MNTEATVPKKVKLADLDPLRQAYALLGEQQKRAKYNSIKNYYPEEGRFRRELYKVHTDFFAAGAVKRERCIIAANRIGKSELGSYEVALHLTGNYPEWWTGRRFARAVKVWAVGDTTQTVRDIAQLKLLGPIEAQGTGMIPNNRIINIKAKAGSVPDAVETIKVKHRSGGVSAVTFKSYDQKRKSFQGTHQDVVWLDEECPEDIYGECLIRTADTGDENGKGIMMLTFTPLSGLTPVVLRFLPGGKLPKEKNARFVIMAGWDDVPHLGETEKAELLEATPVYLRKARSKGIPQLGSGAIYPLAEENLIVDPFPIPDYWPRAYGFDVGWKKTAGVWGAWDRDADCWYLFSEYYQGEAEPAIHAASVKAKGEWIPGVIDPAARGRNQKDGEKLIELYTDAGLNITPANNAVEAGLFACYQRMTEGRIKVFSTMVNWLGEYRIYRRDDKGKVVKDGDHLMDAMRYLIMSGGDVATIKREVKESWRDRLKAYHGVKVKRPAGSAVS